MDNKLLTFFLFLLIAKEATAQDGPHPSHIKWRSIENNAVRVIFPDSSLKDAQRIADIIAHINQKATVSVGTKSKKIDLLLNTNKTQPNGYVALAPYRSEFYATGFQNFNILGSVNWLDALAIHEYRHSLQYSNANRGYTKLLHILNGEKGWALGSGLSIPDWFFEGDAVVSETVLTLAGRGRTPSFFEIQRALLLSGKKYSYMQSRNGSFKKLLPDHYTLGYTMVNYGRNHFGPEIWSKVLADAGKYRFILYPFWGSLEYYSGLSPTALYEAAYTELQTQWQKELDSLKLTPTKSITNINPKVVTNYLFPHFLDDGSIVCLKSSFDETPKLIQIKDGIETSLTAIGQITEYFLGFGNNQATWTEMRKNARRNALEYSVIMSFDLASRQKKQLTHKTRYFSPVFSSDGSKLLAIDASTALKNSIKIISAHDGSIIQSIPNEQNDFLSYPKWANNNSSIVYLAKRKSKISMLKYDLVSNTTIELTNWSSHTIGAYTIVGNLVYFSSSFSGINNIYTVNLNGDKQINQITSVSIGANMPAISKDGKLLVLVEQTPTGKHLSSLNMEESTHSLPPIKSVEPINMARYRVLTNNSEHDLLDTIPEKQYQVRKYNGIIPGIKLHSWGRISPLTESLSDISAYIEMTDILENFSSSIYGRYNDNENATSFGGSIKYSKYYLPIVFRANSRNRASYDRGFSNSVFKGFKQVDVGLGVDLPLSWIRGNYTTGLQVSSFLNHISISDYPFTRATGKKSLNFNSLQLGVYFTNTRQRGLQNLNSKWSQSLQLDYQKSLDQDVLANQFTLRASTTAVGLMKNHGLRFTYKLFKESYSNNYLYEDLFSHARGYEANARDLEQVFSVDYSLPLLYPDFGLGGLFFMKRVRMNLFYDMGKVYQNFANKTKVLDQNSTGAELLFDTKILNILPLTFGVRGSYLINTDPRDPRKEMQFVPLLVLEL